MDAPAPHGHFSARSPVLKPASRGGGPSGFSHTAGGVCARPVASEPRGCVVNGQIPASQPSQGNTEAVLVPLLRKATPVTQSCLLLPPQHGPRMRGYEGGPPSS